MKVKVEIKSELLPEEPSVTFPGEIKRHAEGFTLFWKEEKRGEAIVESHLSWEECAGIIQLTRQGETCTDMRFIAGEKSEFAVCTPYGNIPACIETHKMKVEGRDHVMDLRIILVYDICFEGEQPLRNDMNIYVTADE